MNESFWYGKRVLITGVDGFVGPYLAEYLLAMGAKVTGQIRRRADGRYPQSLIERRVALQIQLVEADLNDIYSVASVLDSSRPEIIFHLASQSFVAHSFAQPIETFMVNTMGTASLLEVVRVKKLEPVIVFAGSSEEYGLVFVSEADYSEAKRRYGVIHPEPKIIPELPITEEQPLRPMSPYAVSKVHGELLMHNYRQAYGLRTVVSRGFNHEGAGRGQMFVTSEITRQVMRVKLGEADRIVIGNVNAFRDWSHVKDIVRGYCMLAEKGVPGDVYNQGSMRTNSVLTYILLSLETVGYRVRRIFTPKSGKEVIDPTQKDTEPFLGVSFEKTKIDRLLLQRRVEFTLGDTMIVADTDGGEVIIQFDENRFRKAEVPILLCDSSKIQAIGFTIQHSLGSIIQDQLNYYLSEEKRKAVTTR
ncbi:MAG: GDP-mannose 4,6-dehydratase [SAR202 cluster bacterium]|nr:GDP-mannose 4,6-dehydratase [SAR202 cluster bacterium]